MAIRSARELEQRFRDQPGRCPLCGATVQPRDDEVSAIGVWDGQDADGGRTAGTVFGANCQECGIVLKKYGGYKWSEGNPAATIWYTDGARKLVGGDRWRGRPGSWTSDDAPCHETRLRELQQRLGSLDDAVRILHATAGLGALHLSWLVERVAGLEALEAKRLVVRALSPTLGETDAKDIR